MSTSPDGNNHLPTRVARWNVSEERRLDLIRKTTAVAAILGCAASAPLWFLSDRSLPLAPVNGLFTNFQQCNTVLSLSLIGTLLASCFRARVTVAAVALITIQCLADQTRFQPWLYQYLLILSGLALPEKLNGGSLPTLNAYRLMFVAIYFWSGFYKINWTYAHMVFPWLLGNAIKNVLGVSAVESLAIVSAIGELLIGLGLLFARTRAVALWCCVVLHLGILLRLGPLSYGWNSVIWPWNLAMIAIAILLFRNTPEASAKEIAIPRSCFHWSIMVLCCLAPALSALNMWDFYPSFHLYSGDHQAAKLKLSPAFTSRIPDDLLKLIDRNDKGEQILHFEPWCEKTLNVPPYPAERVYRSLAQSIADQYGGKKGDVVLILEERPDLLTGQRAVRFIDLEAADTR